MDDNDVVLGLKLVNKAIAVELRSRTAVRLSQPIRHEDYLWQLRRPSALRALTRTKRRLLLGLTAASGSLPNLQAAIKAVGLLPYQLTGSYPDHTPFLGVSESAGEAGHLHICVWLHERGWSLDSMLRGAARGGHRAVCEWALAQGAYVLEAPWVAGGAGHLDLMHWLEEEMGPPVLNDDGNDDDYYEYFCEYMLLNASLPLLQHVAETWSEIFDRLVISEEPLGWAFSAVAASQAPDWQACFICMEEMAAAAGLDLRFITKEFQIWGPLFKREDAVARLQWLLQRGYNVRQVRRLRAKLFQGAAANTAALRYLLEVWNHAPVPHAATNCAAEGNLEALQQVLHPAGWIVDPRECCRRAAGRGHLPVVQWLVSTFGDAIQLDAELMEVAVGSGNLELVAWLRARGCAWSARCYSCGVWSDCSSEEVLERLVEMGCPMPEDGEPYVAAVERGDAAMLACLRRLGCPVAPGTLRRCLRADITRSDVQRQELARTWCVYPGGQMETASTGATDSDDPSEDSATDSDGTSEDSETDSDDTSEDSETDSSDAG